MDTQVGSAKKKMPLGRLILIIVVAVVAAIFIFSNMQAGDFKILGWGPWTLPMWIWRAIAFLLGKVFGGAIRSLSRKVRGKPNQNHN